MKTEENNILIEKVYLRVERLDITKEEYRWRLVNERVFAFRVGGGSGNNNMDNNISNNKKS